MSQSVFQALKRTLTGYLTIMVVPHGTSKPRQITVTLSFLIFSLMAWAGLTGWAAYLAAQHIDYWRSGLYTQMLNLKVAYLDSEIHRFKEKIDDVKDVEVRLRDLLQMGSRKAIIEGQNPGRESVGQGGPTVEDRERLLKVLRGETITLSWVDLEKDLTFLNEDYTARLKGYEEIQGWISKERRLFRATPTGWPAIGHVSSHFGFRTSSFTNLLDFHAGVDIAGAWGSPIRATADGVVSMAGWEDGYGKLVILNHGLGFSSLYGHLSKCLVKEGEAVYRNQVIGLMGATGRATGPHCHYEVWRYGKTINPTTYMLAQGESRVRNSKKL